MTSLHKDCIGSDDVGWDELESKWSEGKLRTCAEESTAFERFRAELDKTDTWKRVVHTDPCAAVRKHEHDGAPDFLVERQNDILGVEIQTLTIPEKAKKAHTRSKILEMAESEYREVENAPVWVDVTFKDRLKLSDTTEEAVAKELCSIVEQRQPTEGDTSHFEIREVWEARKNRKFGDEFDSFAANLSTLTGVVTDVGIRRFAELDASKFVSPGSAWIPEFDGERLESEFQSKAKKYGESYSHNADEVWLLGVYGVARNLRAFQGQMTLDVSDGAHVNLPFDRTYVLGGSDDLRRVG